MITENYFSDHEEYEDDSDIVEIDEAEDNTTIMGQLGEAKTEQGIRQENSLAHLDLRADCRYNQSDICLRRLDEDIELNSKREQMQQRNFCIGLKASSPDIQLRRNDLPQVNGIFCIDHESSGSLTSDGINLIADVDSKDGNRHDNGLKSQCGELIQTTAVSALPAAEIDFTAIMTQQRSILSVDAGVFGFSEERKDNLVTAAY